MESDPLLDKAVKKLMYDGKATLYNDALPENFQYTIQVDDETTYHGTIKTYAWNYGYRVLTFLNYNGLFDAIFEEKGLIELALNCAYYINDDKGFSQVAKDYESNQETLRLKLQNFTKTYNFPLWIFDNSTRTYAPCGKNEVKGVQIGKFLRGLDPLEVLHTVLYSDDKVIDDKLVQTYFNGRFLSKPLNKSEFVYWFEQSYLQWLQRGIIQTSLKVYKPPKEQKNVPIKSFGCYNPPQKQSNKQDSSKAFLLYTPQQTWKNGQTLIVAFMDKSNPLRNDKVFGIAKEWEKYCHIFFKLAATDEEERTAPIRITYNPSTGSYSYIGTECRQIQLDECTMNLGWFYSESDPDDNEYRRTVLHEFGHALGFFHELQHPSSNVPWNMDKVVSYYKKFGYTAETVKSNITDKLDTKKIKDLRGTKKIDYDSIMCYYIDPYLLKDEYQNSDKYRFSQVNYTLSEKDQYYAMQAYPYPLSHFPENSKVIVKGMQDLVIYTKFSREIYGDIDISVFANCKGTVAAIHPVNGVLVYFEEQINTQDNKKILENFIWFEPKALIPEEQNTKIPDQAKRIFPGTYVSLKKTSDTEVKQVGQIVYTPLKKYKPEDTRIYVDMNGTDIIPIDVSNLEFDVRFQNEDISDIDQVDIRLIDFALDQEVKVKSIKDVINALEYSDIDVLDVHKANADKTGKVTGIHLTNGIKVSFGNRDEVWYEPGCLKITQPSSLQKFTDERRFLVYTKVVVEIKSDDAATQALFGNIVMHKDNDDKISVRINNEIKNYEINQIQTQSDYDKKQSELSKNQQHGLWDTLKSYGKKALNSDMGKALTKKGLSWAGNKLGVSMNLPASQNTDEAADEFMQGISRAVFGINSSDLVFLPVKASPVSGVTGKIDNDLGMLKGSHSAAPRNSSFQPGSDILGQMKNIFELGTYGGEQVSEADKVKYDDFQKQVDNYVEQKKNLYDKIVQAPEMKSDYQDSIENYTKMIKILQSQQRDILNAYGNAALAHFKNQFKPDEPVKVFPTNYVDLIKNYEKNDDKYSQVTYSHSFSKTNFSSSSVSYSASASYTPFFSAEFAGKNERTNLSETFSECTFEGKIFQGHFARPWLNESLFQLENITLSSFKEGSLSNGDDLDKLSGTLSLIPISFVIAKDVAMSFGSRNSQSSTSLDEYGGSVSVSYGPFSFGASSSYSKSSEEGQSQSSNVKFSTPEPQLFGVICKRVEKFPKKDSPVLLKQHMMKPQIISMLNDRCWQMINKGMWEFKSQNSKEPRMRFNPLTQQVWVEDTAKKLFFEHNLNDSNQGKQFLAPQLAPKFYQYLSQLQYYCKDQDDDNEIKSQDEEKKVSELTESQLQSLRDSLDKSLGFKYDKSPEIANQIVYRKYVEQNSQRIYIILSKTFNEIVIGKFIVASPEKRTVLYAKGTRTEDYKQVIPSISTVVEDVIKNLENAFKPIEQGSKEQPANNISYITTYNQTQYSNIQDKFQKGKWVVSESLDDVTYEKFYQPIGDQIVDGRTGQGIIFISVYIPPQTSEITIGYYTEEDNITIVFSKLNLDETKLKTVTAKVQEVIRSAVTTIQESMKQVN